MKHFRHFLVLTAALLLVATSCHQDPFIYITSPVQLIFPQDGGSQTFSFSTNKDWSVSSSASWCTVSPSSGSANSNATIAITVDKNPDYDPRNCSITIRVEELSETLRVTQEQAVEIVVNNPQVSVGWKPETAIVDLQSNTAFKVIPSEPSWCKAEILSSKGLVGAKVSLTVKANTGSAPRSQTVTIQQLEGSLERELVLTQGVPEELVDLGLSVKWRAYNLGAEGVLGCGDYYAWGETETKDQYLASNYKWYQDGNVSQITKYSIKGDGKYVLEPEDDAAAAVLGGEWRMPTYNEAKELMENCTVKFIGSYYESGVPGVLFTSKVEGFEGAELFFPYSGNFTEKLINDRKYAEVWTSTLCIFDGSTEQPSSARALVCNSGSGSVICVPDYRVTGLPIRPVQ